MDWIAFMQEAEADFAALSPEIPATAAGFNAMSGAAKTNGALDEKTKEIMALGIGIATRCDTCIGFHTRSLVRLGLTRAEMLEALAMAAYMGGGPSYAYSARALKAYDAFAAAAAG